jgi:hypothetical protein
MAMVVPAEVKTPEECGLETANKILLFDLKNLKKTVLVKPDFDCQSPESSIFSIEALAFSLDNKTLYFQSTAWAVSGALHAIDVDGKNLRFLAPSNEFHLITEGAYAGDLAVFQHRYFIPYGSYNAYWAYDPQGNEIGLIGENLSQFEHNPASRQSNETMQPWVE